MISYTMFSIIITIGMIIILSASCGPVRIFVSMTLNLTKHAAKGTVPFLSTIAARRCP
jgi:hypothetical protein